MMMNARSATREQLLRAIESGEHLPDQFLPIGIHRVSATRYRALLCTGGHKFKGPTRDSIREAMEDRRKLCEQTGVDFVIYGKQTHVKGERPIGWQNAAVYEDGSTSVPVIPGRTVPKDLSAAIRVAPVSKPSHVHGGASTTVSGRFAAPRAPADAQAAAAQTTGQPATLTIGADGEEMVCSRRKAQYAEYRLSKRERKILMGAANRNRVLSSHPYNLLVEDVSLLALNHTNDTGLAPVSVQVAIEDKTINDKFLWSVHSNDQTGLDVYLTGLLMDAGLNVTYDRIQTLRKIVDDQLVAFRTAVLYTQPTQTAKTTTVQIFLDKIKMNAYTGEEVAKEFAQVYAAEHGMTDTSAVLWQVIDQCVAARANDLAGTIPAPSGQAPAATATATAAAPAATPQVRSAQKPTRSSNKSR